MAAQYTEISLDDMERFLKRGFRSLRPKKGEVRGEVYYDLFLSPNVAVRIWTSVKPHSGMGAGVGQDAIRVQFWGVKSKRPLKKGKSPIVKRTQNWRNSLQDRIEDLIEEYEDKEDYWESSGGREPEERAAPGEPAVARPPAQGPTDKQVGYVKFLLSTVDEDAWEGNGWDRRFKVNHVPAESDLRQMPGWMVSKLIDALKDAGYGQRQYRRWASFLEGEPDIPFDEPEPVPDYDYSR